MGRPRIRATSLSVAVRLARVLLALHSLLFLRGFGMIQMRRERTALGCGNPTKLGALEGALMISLDLRVGEPVTHVQAPRLKVTGPCFVGFQLPDFRLRVVCGGVPQTFWPHSSGGRLSTVELDPKQDEYVRSLVAGIIDSLVDGEITISITPGDGFSTVEVRASAEIMSVLIGPKGQMARALRTLLAGSGAKLGRRYALDMVVPAR